MIYGIGTDIILISRITNKESFAKKILSDNEIILWKKTSPLKQSLFLAKQFACKEAVSKALGTGFRDNIFPRDIEILRNDLGKPFINPQENLKKIFSDLGIIGSHVSIADETDYIVAFAIIET
jgi:holo-[acyl-carrier protein] synthase|tara:strand:- start:411 stop:779 length:369 start_codon:yes stop_codon:yes gene_type:complete